MQHSLHLSLTQRGEDQVLTIPHEFALADTEVVLRKVGQRLIIEPASARSLLSVLTGPGSTADDLSDADADLRPGR